MSDTPNAPAPPRATPDRSRAHTVYLGLGANLGDRDAALRAALVALGQPLTWLTTNQDDSASSPIVPIVHIERVSSVYDTAPALVTDQPRFHNIVCMGRTWLSPLSLLHALKQIETRLGRVAGPRYGPRALDIDILLYDDLILQTPELTIPHEGIAQRAFVLLPLAEIAPDLRHPGLRRDVRSLAAEVAGADARRVGRL